jgi:hypothetical protein
MKENITDSLVRDILKPLVMNFCESHQIKKPLNLVEWSDSTIGITWACPDNTLTPDFTIKLLVNFEIKEYLYCKQE